MAGLAGAVGVAGVDVAGAGEAGAGLVGAVGVVGCAVWASTGLAAIIRAAAPARKRDFVMFISPKGCDRL